MNTRATPFIAVWAAFAPIFSRPAAEPNEFAPVPPERAADVLKTTFQRYAEEDGQTYYEKNTAIKTRRVNKPIAPETFSITSLHLAQGDVLIDFILGKQYTYKDGQLVYKSDIQN
jgi:hypothetical protein